MDDLLINLNNGTRIYSPATLKSITTYVLLEQETWFEKEFSFIEHLLSAGMHAIDIGANLGTYSLAMAKAVGSNGRVTSYEPTTATRALLERSRDSNGADHIEVVGCALSDSERTGRIVFEASSELNHLGAAGEGVGEEVQISSLDNEFSRLGWSSPYFIKIDAEGEEIPILKGGRKLLDEQSPLLMLELRAGNSVNHGLIEAVRDIGYKPYRLLGGAPVLVPLDPDKLDPMELNFFAAKPDRAKELEKRGLLVQTIPHYTPGEIANALGRLRALPFAKVFPAQFAKELDVHPDYERALAGYDAWLDTSRSSAERCAALDYGVEVLTALCTKDGRVGRLTTLSRMCAEAGKRATVVPLLNAVIKDSSNGPLHLGEPFWPASPRFDDLPIGDKPAQWFLAGVCEHLEALRSFSTAFGSPSNTLRWLTTSSFASPEMLRRRVLCEMRAKQTTTVPKDLLADSISNVNAALWRSGAVSALPAI